MQGIETQRRSERKRNKRDTERERKRDTERERKKKSNKRERFRGYLECIHCSSEDISCEILLRESY